MGLLNIYSKEHRRIIMAKKISSEEFREFMEEIKENKDKLTPGQFGES